MDKSLNEFTKTHLKALENNSYYTLIIDNVDYEKIYFKSGKLLSEIFDNLNRGIKISETKELKLSPYEIIGFYFINEPKTSYTNNYDFLKLKFSSVDINELITSCVSNIRIIKDYTRKIATEIKLALETIESYKAVEYEMTEKSEEITYSMFYKNENNEKGNKLLPSDALIIFNKIKTSNNFPVIIYCNSRMNHVGRFTTQYSVNFDISVINSLKKVPNSISLLTNDGNVIILDFNTNICKIKINTKITDTTAEQVKILINMIYFEETDISKNISGTISFKVDKVIGIYDLYHFFISNPIAMRLFFIHECDIAWSVNDVFYVFFRDFSNEMLYDTIRSNEVYLRLSISTVAKETITGFNVSFKTKNKEMLPSFLYKFSRLLSYFISINSSNSSLLLQSANVKIYSKVLQLLSDKAPELFNVIGDVELNNRYSKKCKAENQPIIIEEDEVSEWIAYGRTPILFPEFPEEMGLDKQHWFVCPKDKLPYLNFKRNEQDLTGMVTSLPCCNETKPDDNGMNIKVNITGRDASTESINEINSVGVLNEALSSYLSSIYSNDKEYIFKKEGTVFKEKDESFLNSAIIAILKSADVRHITTLKTMNRFEDIEYNISIVRNLMAKLPPDIYKQELYDMSDKEIIESILNPEIFIDPYLYYRGLEEVFNIQLFTFTSNIGKRHPISDFDDELPISSLEVPRCKYMHIRHKNDRDIICLYKNYGTTNKKRTIPACELIYSKRNIDSMESKRINKSNTKFYTKIFELLDLSCHPYEWEKTDDISNSCYDSPYNTVNWSTFDFGSFGKIVGQEIDIYGKTTALLFEEWTLIIPPTQPLMIIGKNEDGSYKKDKIRIGNMIHEYYNTGIKKRAPYKTIKEAIEKFDISLTEEDCVWMEFNGKQKGIKIPCRLNREEIIDKDGKSFDNSNDLITRINNTSILLQIINWLWRCEYTEQYGFPNFIQWWEKNTVIEDSLIFKEVPSPLINCNNMMFPLGLNTFDERIHEMIKIWPFFFYKNKIHVSQELYIRIRNNFNIEDIYSRGMTIDQVFDETGKFIIDLIPTDSDYKSGNDMILTKKEHIIDWIYKNNSKRFKYKSLNNCVVIREKISNNLKNKIEHYIYKETLGDNEGQIYIIQNSTILSEPPYLSALQIANYWRTHQDNPGHEYKSNEDIDFIKTMKFVVYTIGLNGILEVSLDKSNGETDYLQILKYDDNSIYAAMLPILKS